MTVDGLSVSYPDPSFTNNVTKALSSVGYKVDYVGPDNFTVDSFANLPTGGYDLVYRGSHGSFRQNHIGAVFDFEVCVRPDNRQH